MLDLTQEETAEINDTNLRWITEAETAHSAMYDKWNKYDEYFANEQAPSGFTDDHKSKFQEVNDPTVAVQTAKQYVVVNKVRQTHEQVLGDFINGKKVITASGRTPKDRRLANIIKKEFQFVADKNILWERVMFPTIDAMIRRGIHFIKVSHNPYRDIPNGRIEYEQISCREVLLDPNSRDQFYEDKRYIIHRKRYRLDDANEKFKDLIDTGVEFQADNDTADAYRESPNDTTEKFCTIYEIQSVKPEWRYYLQTDPSDEDSLQEITEAEYEKVSKDKFLSQYAFRQQDDVWYVSLYNKGVETFYHQENEFGECTIIEAINIRDESLTYPIADSEYYTNLQDLFNILLSVVLENAKQGNEPIIGVQLSDFAQFKDYIEQTIKKRGIKVLPTQGKLDVVYPQQLNQVVLSLVNMVDTYIQDMQSKHSASMGELPSKVISEKTVDLLVTQDRQAHGRKDITIRYTMSRLAKLTAKIILKKFTEEHWAKLTDSDTKGSEAEYTPVNVTASKEDYDRMLLNMMGVDMEVVRDNNENQALVQQLDAFRKKFENENEVRVRKETIFIVEDGQGGQMQYTDRQLVDAAKSLGLSIEEFKYLYSPKPVIQDFYIINDITDDPEIDLVYDIDFDYERDKKVRQSQAMYAAGQRWITPLRAMQMIDFPDAENAIEEADKRNQILQLGEQVASNPQAMELLRQLFSQQPQPKEAA